MDLCVRVGEGGICKQVEGGGGIYNNELSS